LSMNPVMSAISVGSAAPAYPRMRQQDLP
jgi:hypothetical protein